MTALEIARGELGVCEAPPGSNAVRYNDWYYSRRVSGDTYPWSLTFVQWCFYMSGEPLPYKTASCQALLRWFRQNAPQRVNSYPAPGDIAIFPFGHAGIVESFTHRTVTCIEGGGEVRRTARALADVTAFIRWEEILTDEEIYRRLLKYIRSEPERARFLLRNISRDTDIK